MTKKNQELADFKYLIDSRNLSDKNRKANATAIMKARADRLRERSDRDIRASKLMQLKLQMEEYLNTSDYDRPFSFSKCLSTYVEALYTKKKDFASDMSIEPLMLSQVLNNHREPQEKFMLRLMLHSETAFKTVAGFDPKIWYCVFYKEKVDKVVSSQKVWRRATKMFVTHSRIELI